MQGENDRWRESARTSGGEMEFLVRFEIKVPPELDGEKLDKIMAEEKRRGDLLWSSGRLLRIWRVPGRRASIGLYDFPDATELHAEMSTLPLFPYMTVSSVEPLAVHPADIRRTNEGCVLLRSGRRPPGEHARTVAGTGRGAGQGVGQRAVRDRPAPVLQRPDERRPLAHHRGPRVRRRGVRGRSRRQPRPDRPVGGGRADLAVSRMCPVSGRALQPVPDGRMARPDRQGRRALRVHHRAQRHGARRPRRHRSHGRRPGRADVGGLPRRGAQPARAGRSGRGPRRRANRHRRLPRPQGRRGRAGHRGGAGARAPGRGRGGGGRDGDRPERWRRSRGHHGADRRAPGPPW